MAHTTAKIAPSCETREAVYVSVASRAVAITTKPLAQEETYQDYACQVAAEYALIEERVEARLEKRAVLPLDAARAHLLDFDWDNYTPPQPRQPELQVIQPSLAEHILDVDWSL